LREIPLLFSHYRCTTNHPASWIPSIGECWMIVSRYCFIKSYRFFQCSNFALNMAIQLQIHR
jgi:hypothetical protein